MSELFASPDASKSASLADATDSKSATDKAGLDGPGLWTDIEGAGPATPPSYRVLARKYRPTTFDQLIGQEAMVRTLSNAISSGRLPHAWMLTGVRGIGKTTTARIIARALNCMGPDGKGGATIEPCGVCDACRSIAEDRHVDVMEMDAASRTGVDDIREIVDGVRYGPVSARYKIYILDEVHMLSKNAFNALLKTLEEPPPHTKFIFATTEIRKVPVTVLSRCQRFDLRRIDSETLAKHFADVALKEGATVEMEASRMIAHAADGSVRDGLSLLDQGIARGNGTVTAGDVKDMLGLADRGQSIALCRQLMRGEMKAALETFTAMHQAGSDPVQVLQDMCDLVHLLTRGQVVGSFAQEPSLPEYDRQLLTDLGDIKVPALARAWQILLKGIGEVQNALQPAQAAEMVLIRLAYAAELPLPADLIKQLRQAADTSAAAGASGPGGGSSGPRAKMTAGGSVARDPVSAIATQALPSAESAPHPMPTSYKELVQLFTVNKEGPLSAQLYNNVHPVRCEPGLLEIRVDGNTPTNFAARLTQCLTQWTGQRWMVSISSEAGDITLAEQDRRQENARKERALAHPLMLAVAKAFPDAKLVGLKQKPVAVAPVLTDDGALPTDTDEPLSPIDSED
ncbi:MAG: DNA polymerase III subunit gamma/tau [Pseudomonadota bacterium]|nr:DNA polymerase III subunit gamma/tau [Pseudomonadota bacterium]